MIVKFCKALVIGFGLMIVASFALIVGVTGFTEMHETPTVMVPVAPLCDDRSYAAYPYARDYVKRQLRDPDSAVFADKITGVWTNDCIYTFQSTVRAKNGLGGVSIQRYEIGLTPVDGGFFDPAWRVVNFSWDQTTVGQRRPDTRVAGSLPPSDYRVHHESTHPLLPTATRILEHSLHHR